jgi:hypothetical protein
LIPNILQDDLFVNQQRLTYSNITFVVHVPLLCGVELLNMRKTNQLPPPNRILMNTLTQRQDSPPAQYFTNRCPKIRKVIPVFECRYTGSAYNVVELFLAFLLFLGVHDHGQHKPVHSDIALGVKVCNSQFWCCVLAGYEQSNHRFVPCGARSQLDSVEYEEKYRETYYRVAAAHDASRSLSLCCSRVLTKCPTKLDLSDSPSL